MKRMSITKQKHTEYVRCTGGDSMILVAQQWEISPTQTPCSKTYTVKVIKQSAIFLIIMKTVCCVETRKPGLLENRKLRNFSRHHALYHPDVLYSVQLKVKVRLLKIRA